VDFKYPAEHEADLILSIFLRSLNRSILKGRYDVSGSRNFIKGFAVKETKNSGSLIIHLFFADTRIRLPRKSVFDQIISKEITKANRISENRVRISNHQLDFYDERSLINDVEQKNSPVSGFNLFDLTFRQIANDFSYLAHDGVEFSDN
jgi:hypothetical protein